jgi:hypothetical protein
MKPVTRKCRLIPFVVAFLAMSLFGSFGSWAQTPVFINEIHYDNTGTDTG